jgi:hypothetical protein
MLRIACRSHRGSHIQAAVELPTPYYHYRRDTAQYSSFHPVIN